jgi:t-SNARE complex subunit (syntaxin)
MISQSTSVSPEVMAQIQKAYDEELRLEREATAERVRKKMADMVASWQATSKRDQEEMALRKKLEEYEKMSGGK